MSLPNCDLSQPRERPVDPAHNQAPTQAVVPIGFALYLGDIQECLLNASAASDAMIQAKFDNDLPAMAQACAVATAETRSAAALAARLGKHISAHRRRHEGGHA